MDDIIFEVDQTPQINLATTKESTLARWIIKLGITDDIVTSNYIIVAIAGICIGISIFIYAGILNENKQIQSSVEERKVLNDTLSFPFN